MTVPATIEIPSSLTLEEDITIHIDPFFNTTNLIGNPSKKASRNHLSYTTGAKTDCRPEPTRVAATGIAENEPKAQGTEKTDHAVLIGDVNPSRKSCSSAKGKEIVKDIPAALVPPLNKMVQKHLLFQNDSKHVTVWEKTYPHSLIQKKKPCLLNENPIPEDIDEVDYFSSPLPEDSPNILSCHSPNTPMTPTILFGDLPFPETADTLAVTNRTTALTLSPTPTLPHITSPNQATNENTTLHPLNA